MKKVISLFYRISLLSLCLAAGYSAMAETGSESAVVNIMAGRPEATSITLNLLAFKPLWFYIEYRRSVESYDKRTELKQMTAGSAIECRIDGLYANTAYRYRVRYRLAESGDYAAGDEHFFRTQRAPGQAFAFTVEADPHPYDKKGCHSLWDICLNNQLKDSADFLIDLGDTFGDDHNPFTITNEQIRQLHLDDRYHFGQVCHSLPLLFCLGNHEGESGYYLAQTPPNNLAVYATLWRNYYYPNPGPDDFYTGNSVAEPYGIGLARNYFAWQWGDALFVVLDAYRGYTASAKPREWDWTLGKPQYDWFNTTLANSHARFKLVFIHHVLGETRGGAAVAGGYEWGGYEKDGKTFGFTAKRPGWELPIHQLMVKHGVNILFQGHDHLYAREEVDGIIYQEVPMPSDSTYKIGTTDNGDAFTGVKLDASGHLRVTVSPANIKVDYVRAWLPADERDGHKNGEIAYSYTVGSKTDITQDTVAFVCNELLGRPTAHSITLNLCADSDIEAYVEYGAEKNVYDHRTTPAWYPARVPFNIVLDQLLPDTKYYYRLAYRSSAGRDFSLRPEHYVTTAKSKGRNFTFAVEADPHLDNNTDPDLYRLTLTNVLRSDPDFLIDLGDTFMSEKLKNKTQDSILFRHLLLRSFFDSIGHSVPLFLVLGNHEGEQGSALNGTANNVAVMAARTRLQYFPNPLPDDFYSGNNRSEEFVGLRQNYYSWEWGDALFVVVDPYWYTTVRLGDNWRFTLGKEQYDWFKSVLEKSGTRFKFVFCHQLLGGKDSQGRGGSDYAPFYEMGGLNADGTWGWDSHRPGWAMPLHQLMVKNHVTIFFHGHDHFFAQQERDGLVYQLVPQPGYPGNNAGTQAENYGYPTGKIAGGTGFLRVSVTDTAARVDYVRSLLPSMETSQQKNGMVEHSYSIKPSSPLTLVSRVSEPVSFQLAQNYPNPFNPVTTIGYDLPATGQVSLKVYDISGKEVRVLVNRIQDAGTYSAVFDASQMPSGFYFCVLSSPFGRAVRKMALVK